MSIRRSSGRGKKRRSVSKTCVRTSNSETLKSKEVSFEGETFTIYQSDKGRMFVDPENADIFKRFIKFRTDKKKIGETKPSKVKTDISEFMGKISIHSTTEEEQHKLVKYTHEDSGSSILLIPSIEGSASVPKHMRDEVIEKLKKSYPQFKDRSFIWDIEGNQSVIRVLDAGISPDQYRTKMMKHFVPEIIEAKPEDKTKWTNEIKNAKQVKDLEEQNNTMNKMLNKKEITKEMTDALQKIITENEIKIETLRPTKELTDNFTIKTKQESDDKFISELKDSMKIHQNLHDQKIVENGTYDNHWLQYKEREQREIDYILAHPNQTIKQAIDRARPTMHEERSWANEGRDKTTSIEVIRDLTHQDVTKLSDRELVKLAEHLTDVDHMIYVNTMSNEPIPVLTREKDIVRSETKRYTDEIKRRVGYAEKIYKEKGRTIYAEELSVFSKIMKAEAKKEGFKVKVLRRKTADDLYTHAFKPMPVGIKEDDPKWVNFLERIGYRPDQTIKGVAMGEENERLKKLTGATDVKATKKATRKTKMKTFTGYIKIREWVIRTPTARSTYSHQYLDNPIRSKEYPIVQAKTKAEAIEIYDNIVTKRNKDLNTRGTVTLEHYGTRQKWYAESVTSYMKEKK